MTLSAREMLFRLVDEYSRARHNWFVSEFFPDGDNGDYVICFRPMSAERDSQERYDCRYMRLSATELKPSSDAKGLLASLRDLVDAGLAGL